MSKMQGIKITVLDAATLGEDIVFDEFARFGETAVYEHTAPCDVAERIDGSDVVIVNKIRLGAENLSRAGHLKLICVTATGFDNIDIDFCRERGIAVCNVSGYSTVSVAQHTAALALSLVNHIREFDDCVKDGSYTASGVENRLTPVFHELEGMVWGVVGLGAIGGRVARIAGVLGCEVIAYKRKPVEEVRCVSLDELCKASDVISLHLPLTEQTRGIINEKRIGMMKHTAVLINVSRGAVTDEAALAAAITGGRLGGLGIDVYSAEPIRADSPLAKLYNKKNVILTPHMAWGAYESRVRCMREIALNIDAFLKGGTKRNRIV